MPTLSDYIQTWKVDQADRAARVIVAPLDPPRFVAGADAAFSADKKSIHVIALVYDREDRRVIEVVGETQPITFPYVPGYLAYREGPALLAAIRRLKKPFGVICFDGHGVAHPRRAGLATHLGVELDVPTVGFAKSVLVGSFDPPGDRIGDHSPLLHREETVGWALRTRERVNPIFISIGHRIDLPSARALAMACVDRYRIPAPTREADRRVARLKRGESIG